MTQHVTTPIIRTAIAGLGRSGWNMHANALKQLPEHYRITAVMDPSETRRNEAKQTFNCNTYDTFDALLKDDHDLLVIATPSQLHAEQSIKALQAGKHVITEKPLASNVHDVDAMINAAKQAQKILTVNQNYRYHSYYQTIDSVIASGKLGQIIQIRVSIHQFSRRWDWQTLRKNNGGILTNHGAHALDWLLQHFNDPDPEVFCHLVNTPLYAGDADSHAKVIIRPNDGPLIDLELTHSNAYPQDPFLIMGTQGSLSGNKTHLKWKYYTPQNEPPLTLNPNPPDDRTYNKETLHFTEENANLNDPPNQDMQDLYKDLHPALHKGAPPPITPESVRRQIHIFDKCKQSANW